MKTLRSISTAAFIFFTLAVSAASASTISVSLSSTNPTLGTPISYTLSGEAKVKETYEVRIMHVGLPEANCTKANEKESIRLHDPFEVFANATSLTQSETIPIVDYNALGTYAVCAMVRNGPESHYSEKGFSADSTTSFTVVAPAVPSASTPVPPVETPAAPTPAVAPVVAPALVAHVVAPVPAQKPHTAIAKCKKQKNKKKRVKCERAAKKAAHHR